MLIDRAYSPVTTLGPGTRIALWSIGCSKGCPGCANPELWRADPSRAIDDVRLSNVLVEMARKSGIRRITFSGGDPFEQPESLSRVLKPIRPHFDDVLVYTGYTLDALAEYANGSREALEGMPPGDDGAAREAVRLALGLIDALVDGPYIEALNDGVCAMRGSSNQRVHLFNDALAGDYRAALAEPRRVQNVRFGDTCMSIGIHRAAKPESRP